MSLNRERELEERVRQLEQQLATLGVRSDAQAFEYASPTVIWGLPLVHIVRGPDLRTGRTPVAKGIIASGPVAVGLIALGGCAIGAIALGGLALGFLTFGGLSIGLLLAFGGGAVGCIAIGGAAMGYIAFGGGAIGVYAFGGSAFSLRPLAEAVHDPLLPAWFKELIRGALG